MAPQAERDLLVVRHAKSAWPEGVPDHDRPLRAKGERAARRIGRFLAANDLVPDAAVASPARRAADTARLVLEAAGSTAALGLDDRLYGADAWPVVNGLWPRTQRLLVVGHEPELVELVARLTGARIRLPTAALAWLHVDGDGDGDSDSEGVGERAGDGARLHLLLPPKLLDDAD